MNWTIQQILLLTVGVYTDKAPSPEINKFIRRVFKAGEIKLNGIRCTSLFRDRWKLQDNDVFTFCGFSWTWTKEKGWQYPDDIMETSTQKPH